MINFRGGVRRIGVLVTYEGSYWISQHLKLQYPLDERFVLLLFVCFIFKLIPFCLLLELEFFLLRLKMSWAKHRLSEKYVHM